MQRDMRNAQRADARIEQEWERLGQQELDRIAQEEHDAEQQRLAIETQQSASPPPPEQVIIQPTQEEKEQDQKEKEKAKKQSKQDKFVIDRSKKMAKKRKAAKERKKLQQRKKAEKQAKLKAKQEQERKENEQRIANLPERERWRIEDARREREQRQRWNRIMRRGAQNRQNLRTSGVSRVRHSNPARQAALERMENAHSGAIRNVNQNMSGMYDASLTNRPTTARPSPQQSLQNTTTRITSLAQMANLFGRNDLATNFGDSVRQANRGGQRNRIGQRVRVSNDD